MSKQIIHLEELRVKVRLGCREEERMHQQVVMINLSLTSGLTKGSDTDDIADAINYVEVISLIEKLANERVWALVERMEIEIARELFKAFPLIEKMNLRVRKNVFTQVQGVSVELKIDREQALNKN